MTSVSAVTNPTAVAATRKDAGTRLVVSNGAHGEQGFRTAGVSGAESEDDAGKGPPPPKSGLRRNWRGAELVGGARLGVDHVHHRVDERQVRESLREVAQMAAAARVDLLRVELERARIRQQLFAQLACADQLVDLAQRGHQPERADSERALLSMQPVVRLRRPITMHLPAARKL